MLMMRPQARQGPPADAHDAPWRIQMLSLQRAKQRTQ